MRVAGPSLLWRENRRTKELVVAGVVFGFRLGCAKVPAAAKQPKHKQTDKVIITALRIIYLNTEHS